MWRFIKRVFWLLVIILLFALALNAMREAHAEDESWSAWVGRNLREGTGDFVSNIRGKEGPRENRQDNDVIRSEAAEVRHYNLAFIAYFLEQANAPRYCFDHASQDMPDDCYEPISAAVEEAYRELGTLRADIDAEMRDRKLIP